MQAGGRKNSFEVSHCFAAREFFLAFMATHLPPNASTSRISAARPSVATIRERVTNENKILFDRSTRFPAAGRGGRKPSRAIEKNFIFICDSFADCGD